MYKLEKITKKGEAVVENRELEKVNKFFFQEGHRMFVKIVKSDETL